MTHDILDRIEMVEVQCDTAKTIYRIGDIDNLRGKLIKAVEVFKVAKVSLSPTGRALANDTVFLKSSLTLSIDGEESIDTVPFTVFNTADNDGKLKQFVGDGKVVNWPKSEIKVASSASLSSSESFLIAVYYRNVN